MSDRALKAADDLAEAVAAHMVGAVRWSQNKITDAEYDATTRLLMDAMKRYGIARKRRPSLQEGRASTEQAGACC